MGVRQPETDKEIDKEKRKEIIIRGIRQRTRDSFLLINCSKVSTEFVLFRLRRRGFSPTMCSSSLSTVIVTVIVCQCCLATFWSSLFDALSIDLREKEKRSRSSSTRSRRRRRRRINDQKKASAR